MVFRLSIFFLSSYLLHPPKMFVRSCRHWSLLTIFTSLKGCCRFFLHTWPCPNNLLEKGKGMVLYSAVSSPLDRSKRFTLSFLDRPVHSDTVLGFSWKHSSHAAIAQRLFNHISTTVYSQVLIYTAESTEAS